MGREQPARLPAILGQNLYVIRLRDRRWTQAEMARFTGYSVREIQRLEQGKRNVTIVTLGLIARAYGVEQPWKLLKPAKFTITRKAGRPRGGKWLDVTVTEDGEAYINRPKPRRRRRPA